MAADSLTSQGKMILSCTTEKLSQVAPEAVTASSGLSRVQGANWQAILSRFYMPSHKAPFATTVADLQTYLNGVIGNVPKNNFGACRGGNTFLVAGFDSDVSGMAVAKLTRIEDRRQFEPVTFPSPSTDREYIEWMGDISPVAGYIATKNSQYAPAMLPDAAVTFAISAIIGGITASQAAGNHTIGGEFVSIAEVTPGGVRFSKHPTGIPCTVG